MRASSVVLASLAGGLVAVPHGALAGERTGLGLGVESTLTGVTGPTVTYQTPRFHVEGLLGFRDQAGQVRVDLFGRFFFEVHETSRSDFSIGGGLGVERFDNGMDETFTDFHLEAGGQIRAFVTSNVALSATLGLGFVTVEGDSDRIGLVGQLVGGLGVSYFFY